MSSGMIHVQWSFREFAHNVNKSQVSTFYIFLSYRRRQWKNCSALWKVPLCIFDSLETVLSGTQLPIKGAKIAFHRSSLPKCLWKTYSLSRSHLFIVENLTPNVSSIFLWKSFSALSLIRCAKNPRITQGKGFEDAMSNRINLWTIHVTATISDQSESRIQDVF